MPRSPLFPILESQGFVVLDGGLATELERRGADLQDPLWSAKQLLDGPNLIRLIHEAYFAAGADVAVTASYQASISGFEARGLDRARAGHLISLSVELAREARQRYWDAAGRFVRDRHWPLVAGSVGPYGAALADGSEYRGHYGISGQALADFHGPRLEALISAGPDLLALETIPSPDEAVLVLELLAAWPEMQAWVSFTCRDGGRVSEGQPVAEAIGAVTAHPQVIAVGFNCVAPRLVDELLIAAALVTEKSLVVYPNSGEGWDAGRRAWTAGDGPFDFGRAAPRWLERGARLIGGCCRTTPETIRTIRDALERRSLNAPSEYRLENGPGGESVGER